MLNVGPTRKTDQTIVQYINELRSLAVNCKVGASPDEHLRDQVLIGLNNLQMLQQLLMDHSDVEAKLVDIEQSALINY